MKQVTTMICVVAEGYSTHSYLRQRPRWPMSTVDILKCEPMGREDDLPFWKMFRDLRRELPIFNRYLQAPKGLNEI